MGPANAIEIKLHKKNKIMRDKKNTILDKYYNANMRPIISSTHGTDEQATNLDISVKRENEYMDGYYRLVPPQSRNGVGVMGNYSSTRSSPLSYGEEESLPEKFPRETGMNYTDNLNGSENRFIQHFIPIGSLHLSSDPKSLSTEIKSEPSRMGFSSEFNNVFSHPPLNVSDSKKNRSHPSLNPRVQYPTDIKSEPENFLYPSVVKSELENSYYSLSMDKSELENHYSLSMDKSEPLDLQQYPYVVENDPPRYSPNYYLDCESHSYNPSPSSTYNTAEDYQSSISPNHDSQSNEPYQDRNMYAHGQRHNYASRDHMEDKEEDYFRMAMEDEPLDLSIPKAGAPLPYSETNLFPEEDYGCIKEEEEVGNQTSPEEEEVVDEVVCIWLRKIKTGTRSRVRSPKSWEFLLRLLRDPTSNPSMIRWEDEQSGTFRLVRKDEIAKIWGTRSEKHKDGGLTYDNFARNLRYHYKTKMLLPVSEKHLVYRFGSDVMDSIRRGLTDIS